jgi:CheY-like chemotaxis protein
MDDEEMVRKVASEMLRVLGYEVEAVSDGAEAVDMYSEAIRSGNPFDVVIMDLTIPGGMGGKEAIKKLLEIDPGVKAVVSSGYSEDPVMSDYRKYGFSEVIRKPYKLKEIGKILGNLFNG